MFDDISENIVPTIKTNIFLSLMLRNLSNDTQQDKCIYILSNLIRLLNTFLKYINEQLIIYKYMGQ